MKLYGDASSRDRVRRVGDRCKVDGKMYVVTAVTDVHHYSDGLSFGHRHDEGWSYTVEVRPATDNEAGESKRRAEIVRLEKRLEGLMMIPDDDRNHNAVVAERKWVLGKLADLRS